jgi:hypothetical protein
MELVDQNLDRMTHEEILAISKILDGMLLTVDGERDLVVAVLNRVKQYLRGT